MKKLLAVLLLTASCSNTTEGLNEDLSIFRTKLADKIRPQSAQAVVGTSKEADVFCYKTLSKPDCYNQPQEGQENRLIK